MGETGKRNRNSNPRHGDREGGSAQKRRFSSNNNTNNEGSGGDGELVVYRILCPNPLMGGVIGKGGKVINSIRNETRAKVKVVDPFPGSDHRVLTVYCYVRDKDPDEIDEEGDDPLCAAQDALLRLHDAVLTAKANQLDSDDGDRVECRILVPGSQAANVIGKGGATVKRLRSRTGANIRINPKDPNDPMHSCAMGFDNFVVIAGEEDSVKKALYAISAIMYKFPPREEISLDTSVVENLPSIIVPPDVPIYPAGGLYPSMDPVVPPPAIPPVVGPPPSVPEYPGYADTVGSWPGYPPAVPVVPAPSGPSKSEELVLKVLCPGDKIGRVIGKGGSSIKSVRQASGAQIDVVDAKRGGESIIMVTSTESMEDLKSSAVEAVLLLQEKISDEDEERVNMRFLVPKAVVGCLIGKGGVIVNEMRKTSRADIRISKGEKPRCASADDELVEVFGEVSHVRDALLQIILKLRDDVLRDKDSGRNAPPPEPAYTSGYSVPPVMPAVPPASSLGYDQRVEAGSGMGMLTGGSLYGYSSLQGGDNGYGSLSSYGSKSFGGLPPFEMVIPANALSKVLGKGGANLANIRKISGANIEILESKSSRSERIAQISGTQEQMRSAENLIHAFIMAT